MQFALVLFVIAALLTTQNAAAAEPVPLATPSLNLGWSCRHAGIKGARATQQQLTLQPEFLLFGRVEVAPHLAMSRTTAGIEHRFNLPFDARLTFPWQPTVGLSAGYRAYDGDTYRLTLSAGYATQLGSSRAAISGFKPQGVLAAKETELRGQLAFIPEADIAFRVFDGLLPGNPDVRYDWSEARFLVGNRFVAGPLALRLDVGLLITRQSLRVGIDPTVRALLEDEGVDIPRRLQRTQALPELRPGIELPLGHGYAVQAGGFLIPTSDFTYWQATIGVTVPLGFP